VADSRNKGASFERDIVKRLNLFFEDNEFDFKCKRNLDQYQTKDLSDIEIPFHSIECKAYKDGWWYKPEWWKQICQACNDLTPVLVYKFNNKAIRVCIPLHYINTSLPHDNFQTAVVTFDQWLAILKQKLIPDKENCDGDIPITN
jgi:hypothetical protein|tara:strand:+ start:57 stop:491 length:435 start_codon:yes stop_codon:yes gene_type:complete